MKSPLTDILPMAFLQACLAESPSGLLFLPSACDLQKVFVDETLRHHRHHEIVALPVYEPNLSAETPDSVEIDENMRIVVAGDVQALISLGFAVLVFWIASQVRESGVELGICRPIVAHPIHNDGSGDK